MSASMFDAFKVACMAKELGSKMEREAIVSWLREQRAGMCDPWVAGLCDAVERGEHLETK